MPKNLNWKAMEYLLNERKLIFHRLDFPYKEAILPMLQPYSWCTIALVWPIQTLAQMEMQILNNPGLIMIDTLTGWRFIRMAGIYNIWFCRYVSASHGDRWSGEKDEAQAAERNTNSQHICALWRYGGGKKEKWKKRHSSTQTSCHLIADRFWRYPIGSVIDEDCLIQLCMWGAQTT